MIALSEQEQRAVLKALKYWVRRWDFECPTLFGIEKAELQAVAEAWPELPGHKPYVVFQAVNGAFRELLYGASAVSEERLPGICGLSYSEASELSDRLYKGLPHE